MMLEKPYEQNRRKQNNPVKEDLATRSPGPDFGLEKQRTRYVVVLPIDFHDDRQESVSK